LDVPQPPADIHEDVPVHRKSRSVVQLLSKAALIATLVLDFIGASSQNPNVQSYIFSAVFFTVIIGIGAGITAGTATNGLRWAGANLFLGLVSIFVFVASTLDNQ
jgi:hypothetical protein